MPSDNPILNNPYEEPVAHYATNLDGELDYERVVSGRRVFTPDIQSVPAYHFCNRQEYRNDVRFADNFLAVAPGITIRDRLGVLSVRRESGTEGMSDYYSERLLVPPGDMRKNFASLNAHLAITNFQTFQPRTLQGNKRSPFDGKIGADGKKTEATEDYAQVIKRLLPGFRAGSRLLVLNDEAHHCYLPKQGDQRKAEGENTEQENARAAVWFRGLVELARRFKIRTVYDLSATPYYLNGSGYKRPPTLLIDSDALENSGQIDEGFKRVFAAEIEQFKSDYRVIHGAAAAENITDAEILREIVNTVGKRGTLGAHLRCVVSVSMLTEGWDANTVTHVVGIRAFGSQLLCEQVAGRALRRKSYALAPYDPDSGERLSDQIPARRKRDAQRTRQPPRILWKFPPEYAHIIGVPFRQFKPGTANPPPPQPTIRVHPLEERAAACEIIFPNIDGYRIEYPEGALKADFSRVADYEIPANEIPTRTVLENAFAADKVKLSLDDLLSLRDQPILFRITKDLIRDHFSDDPTAPAFHRFSELHAIVTEWYESKVCVLGKGPEWKKLLYYWDPKKLVAAVAKGIATGQPGEPAVRAILNFYNPSGSTRFVHGMTSKECYESRHSHVNVVVLDSGWEGQAAKVLDDLAEEGRVETWVKNHFLQFRIPYVADDGESHDYLPDFIVRTRDRDGTPFHLIVEVTGARRDKYPKVWTASERWVPAVNALPAARGFGRRDFLEIAGETKFADFRNILLQWLDAPADTKPRIRASVMSLRKEFKFVNGPITDDFELPARNNRSRPDPFADD